MSIIDRAMSEPGEPAISVSPDVNEPTNVRKVVTASRVQTDASLHGFADEAQESFRKEAPAGPQVPELRLVDETYSSRGHARSLARLGRWFVLIAIVPFLVWMAVAPLSMAVVAPAFVKVELNRRPVQHREGGIVREVLVRDGQHVNAGQPILILGDVGVDAERNRITYRVYVESAALVRLEAERALDKKLEFPDDLMVAAEGDERVNQALQKEQGLFQARRSAFESEVSLMKQQRGQIEQEIAAIGAQISRARSSYALQANDLETNRGLAERGFVARNRVTELEASVMDYASKLEERRSELARARQRLVDVDLKINSIRNEFVTTASDQLKDTSARLDEIEQELRKSEDAAARQVVIAPAGGAVIDLKFTSPGAVVAPGELIADIVPSDAKLMIEARIKPEEINHVQVDQSARIKFTAFKYRNISMVTGKVSYVSADRLIDKPTNQPYYSVTILADPDSVQAAGDLKLQAGMPAEVYIDGAKQTALQYLVEPVASTFRKAARQM